MVMNDRLVDDEAREYRRIIVVCLTSRGHGIQGLFKSDAKSWSPLVVRP